MKEKIHVLDNLLNFTPEYATPILYGPNYNHL
jgi:hypothetical protein